MLVIRSSDNTVILSLTEHEIDQVKAGNLCTCFMTQPMVMKNVILMYAKDNETLVKHVKALGIKISESMKKTILEGKRTDEVVGS